jgi:hypothetical protein
VLPSWFQELFGFPEDFEVVRNVLAVERDAAGNAWLSSLANNTRFKVDELRTPSLREIRQEAKALLLRSPNHPVHGQGCTFQHRASEDVLQMHSEPEFDGAMFQAASQFNCLEFVSPAEVPENGITKYQDDNTQVPLSLPRHYCPDVNVLCHHTGSRVLARHRTRMCGAQLLRRLRSRPPPDRPATDLHYRRPLRRPG